MINRLLMILTIKIQNIKKKSQDVLIFPYLKA